MPGVALRLLGALVILDAGAAPAVTAGADASAAAGSPATSAGAGAGTSVATAEERPALFAPSTLCAWCHSNSSGATAMRDPMRREASPVQLWSGTAMANAFRDVIWRAAVVAEVAAAPALEREIVGTCVRCHAPMGARTLPAEKLSLALLEAPVDALTQDGVSCTVCHRISAEGLGEPSTFGGAFRLVEDGRIVGPHRTPFTRPMQHHTDFVPVYGAQILDSGLCGSCHTVITSPLDAATAGAAFLEQAPFLEWRNSAFAAGGKDVATCQACHVPTTSPEGVAIETRIARHPSGRDFPPVDPRAPYGRHVFVGGNALLPRLLASAPAARPDEARPPFEAMAALVERQLSTRTAQLSVDRARLRGQTLSFVARVVNLTGHKFPTGHPSRRAWLRVRVRDAAGRLVFASGEHDAAGRILGGAGTPLPSELQGGCYEPHRTVVRAPDEVQVWESVMEDARGAVTELLLKAFKPRKDDRLLPTGWSADHPEAARTRPVGTDGDADFEAGGDAVAFELRLPAGAKPPFRIEAAVLFQALGARHAAELVRGDSHAAKALAAALERNGNAPSLVAVARRTAK